MDWNLIVIALGGITAFLTFLYGLIKKPSGDKKDNSWDDWKVNVNENSAIVKEQIFNIRRELDELKTSVQGVDEKTRHTLEKFETRIEKFTDIIIEHLKKD